MNRADRIPRSALVLTLVYAVGLGLLLTPTAWVLRGYFLYLAVLVFWAATAGFVVLRTPRRGWLIATLGPLAALLIWMSVSVTDWVALGFIP